MVSIGGSWETHRRGLSTDEWVWLCRDCDEGLERDSWVFWDEHGFRLNADIASRLDFDVYHGTLWRTSTRRVAASLRGRLQWLLFFRGKEAFTVIDAARLVGISPRDVMEAVARFEAEVGRRKQGRPPVDSQRGPMSGTERSRRSRMQRKDQAVGSK